MYSGINLHNLYGMDETGNTTGNESCAWVIGRKGKKTQHKQDGADHKNITTIVTICVNGIVLKPNIIFKVKHFMKHWSNSNVAEALCMLILTSLAFLNDLPSSLLPFSAL